MRGWWRYEWDDGTTLDRVYIAVTLTLVAVALVVVVLMVAGLLAEA